MSESSPPPRPSPQNPGGSPVDPRLGTKVGKYQILSPGGTGVIGIAYESLDEELQRQVAVEFLPQELQGLPAVGRLFVQAAQLTARVVHPNSVTVLDVGFSNSHPYLVRELLLLMSAQARLQAKGHYPWPVATRIIADLCAALRSAHARDLVHGDIRPASIWFSPAGVVKLGALGLTMRGVEDASSPQLDPWPRTPHFLSPEQAIGRSGDARSDLYSLGATYYALLTGQPPFPGEDATQVLRAHIKTSIPDPRAVVSGIPEQCVLVLRHAMEKERDARYQTAAELAEALERILVGVPGRNDSVLVMEERALAVHSADALRTSQSGQAGGQGSAGGAQGQAGEWSRRRFLGLSALGTLGAMGGEYLLLRRGGQGVSGRPVELDAPAKKPDVATSASLPPFKIGVLHSLSGTLAVSEHPLADASLLAIEELNARGGVLGRQLQPVVVDGKSEVTVNSAFTRGAERLLSQDKVVAVFGGYGSSGRKFITPYFEKYNQLLFYPALYEGLEESQNVIYTGSTPNQIGLPAARWCMETLSAKAFFLIGTDGLRAHAFNAIVQEGIEKLGGEVVGSHYSLVGELDFAAVVKKIEASEPQVILNLLVGDSVVFFFKALVEANITSRTLPVVSFSMSENELTQVGNLSLSGNYVVRSRFPQVDPAAEDSFSRLFQEKYGKHRPVSDTMEAAYYGVYLWAAAVAKAGTVEVNAVRQALKQQEYTLGDVRISVDASTNHTWKVFQLGRLRSDNSIETIQTAEAPLPPIPFPPPRARADWESFRTALYQQWGGNWANPEKPKVLKQGLQPKRLRR